MSVKESKIVEPTVVAPATGKRVSIPEIFNPSMVQPILSSSSSLKFQKPAPPKRQELQQNGNGVAAHQSPSPSPKTRRRFHLKKSRNSDSGTVSEDSGT